MLIISLRANNAMAKIRHNCPVANCEWPKEIPWAGNSIIIIPINPVNSVRTRTRDNFSFKKRTENKNINRGNTCDNNPAKESGLLLTPWLHKRIAAYPIMTLKRCSEPLVFLRKAFFLRITNGNKNSVEKKDLRKTTSKASKLIHNNLVTVSLMLLNKQTSVIQNTP